MVHIEAGDWVIDDDSRVRQGVLPVLNAGDEIGEGDGSFFPFAEVLGNNASTDNLESLVRRHLDPQIVLAEVCEQQLVDSLRSF